MNWLWVFSLISSGSILIPTLSSLLFFKRLNNTYKILSYFFYFSLLIEIVAITFAYVYHNNETVYRVYIVAETIAVLFFFYRTIRSERYKFIITYLLPILLIYSIGIAIFAAKVNMFVVLNYVCYSFFAFILFAEILKFDTQLDYPITKLPYFWFNLGILIFYFVNIINNSAYGLYQKNNYATIQVIFHGVTNIIANILYSYCFYLQWTKR